MFHRAGLSAIRGFNQTTLFPMLTRLWGHSPLYSFSNCHLHQKAPHCCAVLFSSGNKFPPFQMKGKLPDLPKLLPAGRKTAAVLPLSRVACHLCAAFFRPRPLTVSFSSPRFFPSFRRHRRRPSIVSFIPFMNCQKTIRPFGNAAFLAPMRPLLLPLHTLISLKERFLPDWPAVTPAPPGGTAG